MLKKPESKSYTDFIFKENFFSKSSWRKHQKYPLNQIDHFFYNIFIWENFSFEGLKYESSQACNTFLVATDIASKGLDFPEIEHVINYDMPEDIENYIHRIGRTGRGNHQGVATTFINSKSCNTSILLDLKGNLWLQFWQAVWLLGFF